VDVRIIHPVTGGIAEVPESSLPHYYASGWRLLAEGEAPEPEQAPEPEPVTRAQAAGLAASSDSDDSEERQS
jgi:hypothetical protein